MPSRTCRFYANKYPEVDDIVMVNVRSIAEMGAYVSLLEYDGIEGMILLSELSRRRIRSINKLIRVGRNEVVVVLRVDKDKGYIDLSKRRVSAEEIRKCEDKFNKAKAVNSILRHVAETLDLDLEELYVKTAWHFDKKFGNAHEAFKLSITEPDVVFEGVDIDETTKKALISNIKRRLTPQAVKIRADIEVSCYTYEGIDAIISSLKTGLEHSTEEMPVKINLISPPLYVVTATSLDTEKGIECLEKAVESISTAIRGCGGCINVIQAPRAVNETDDKQLADMLEDLEKKNAEIGGDDDNSDSNGSGNESD
eukprot:Nk52_evm11s271 gene=Nk52_evmTU11s271